jgi:general secretion pathway protein G
MFNNKPEKNSMEQKQKNRTSGKRSGFTLIEIILVVVIVGILAGITLKGLNPAKHTQNARIVEATTDISYLASAVDMYEMMNGAYPDSLEGLLDSSKQGYPFLRQNSIPNDPWDNPYLYSVPGSHNTYTYDISCTVPQTDQTISNWGE